MSSLTWSTFISRRGKKTLQQFYIGFWFIFSIFIEVDYNNKKLMIYLFAFMWSMVKVKITLTIRWEYQYLCWFYNRWKILRLYFLLLQCKCSRIFAEIWFGGKLRLRIFFFKTGFVFLMSQFYIFLFWWPKGLNLGDAVWVYFVNYCKFVQFDQLN